MSTYKKYIFLLIFIILAAFAVYYYSSKSSVNLPTYFSYSQSELDSLQSLQSDYKITDDALQKWDNVMLNLVKENKLGDAPASRVYAYVYTAQRDMAFISMNIKNSFMGNIDYISAQTLCLFFQNNCNELNRQSQTADSYSKEIGNLVLNKIKSRMEADQKNIHSYPEKSGKQYWAGVRPYFGADVGSWMPWKIKSVNDFLAPTPPKYDSPEWQQQLKTTKDALHNITPEQKKLVVFWAGNPGTVTPPGLWLNYANNYMFFNNVPLSKIILVRSVLAMGIADAVIAVFNSKYTYQVKRPFMLDPTILTIMPTPNHPSYPAGHSTISFAAATILSYYLPEKKDFWFKNASDASMSRVWGGIHFTIDAKEGTTLGTKVGEAAITSEKH